MKQIGIYIKDTTTLEYNRVELFDDEKISVTSSIQNINDIAKTYTDFSQTFTVPATKQNNKIFKHWYDNSNDSPFSTLVKSDAYIEIDTIPFRKGKIQLESANVVDGMPQDYSITFIGALGNLKDKFNGLYLKDLTDTTYDFDYNAADVKAKVVTNNTSSDVMFPLISSNRYWNYNNSIDPTNNISSTSYPIRYNELFPSIRLSSVLNMIQNDSNILNLNFNGSFLTDTRFTNAYLWLKNADEFVIKTQSIPITYQSTGTFTQVSGSTAVYNLWLTSGNSFITYNGYLPSGSTLSTYSRKAIVNITPTAASINYKIKVYIQNGSLGIKTLFYTSPITSSIVGLQSFTVFDSVVYSYQNNQYYTVEIESEGTLTFDSYVRLESRRNSGFTYYWYQNLSKTSNQTISNPLAIKQYFPEIKIEDFFSGLLKMFNLTCYSTDGINYTVEQLESYYGAGSDIDITKYVIQDKKTLNRVKAYKKINFEYEKSESFINVAFNSANGIEYGSLYYSNTPQAEGEEYSIKLPFEDLNFQNLKDKLQVGYALKTDLQKYIPKPVILYDYNPIALTTLIATDFWFNTSITGGTSTQHISYKAFGQEYSNGTDTYSLNFPPQQSTLTNLSVPNGLYNQYYEKYFSNIFNYKARLIKVSAILPTSILTTLKLNDNVLIRDTKYLINTMTTDLTTGEVQFELLTDQRE